ncbi:MAG TPA: ATP-binding protein [Verrucomicrobiae bacterium]|nr:ATP-binding protein [Verrucomicrobiae bacterium]
MSAATTANWHEANQRHLMESLAVVRAALKGHGEHSQSLEPEKTPRPEEFTSDGPPPALETLCVLFGLSEFERNLLLLCAGVELDSKVAALCAAAQGDPRRDYPTFSLALGTLPEPHWSALTPAAPLRRWRLIEVSPGTSLTLSPLRIDERVLHYLTGVGHLDDRLAGIVTPVPATDDLVASHRALAEHVVASLRAGRPLPVVQLCGHDTAAKRTVAAASCTALGLSLHALAAPVLPNDPRELDTLIRLWEREAALSASALLLDCDDVETGDATNRFIERVGGVLFVASREQRRTRQRVSVSFDVAKPTAGEQRTVWQEAGVNGQADALVAQFDLGVAGIRAAIAQAQTPEQLWDACRSIVRPRLDDLAQRIEPRATWNELVLPGPQLATLHEIAAHVRQRAQVYDAWGFAHKCARGLGISALFAGASGTGKTMAAEVLANELRLDLYRIDLSQVVSKYIGETEKNLRRVFDAAEEGGALLLFDEADALFGKRSEIKDSHDRYANIEVSYLLQRMEAYRGLAILTTNMKDALDAAFLRRIRFVVQFPFPEAAERAEIWRQMFPAATPVDGLDVARLARLNVAGGNIRNIALNAAFLAADTGEPVRMAHVLQAARTEYSKIERPLTEAEIGGWQ